jgi:excisionase family DNA binding protein
LRVVGVGPTCIIERHSNRKARTMDDREADTVDARSSAAGRAGVARKNEVVPPPPDADLWTFGEVAYVLRTSVPSVRRLVDGGHLATTRVTVGDKRLIRREVVKAYLNAATEVALPRGAGVPDSGTTPPAGRPAKVPSNSGGAKGRDFFSVEAPRRGRPKKAAKP